MDRRPRLPRTAMLPVWVLRPPGTTRECRRSPRRSGEGLTAPATTTAYPLRAGRADRDSAGGPAVEKALVEPTAVAAEVGPSAEQPTLAGRHHEAANMEGDAQIAAGVGHEEMPAPVVCVAEDGQLAPTRRRTPAGHAPAGL